MISVWSAVAAMVVEPVLVWLAVMPPREIVSVPELILLGWRVVPYLSLDLLMLEANQLRLG